MKNNIFDCNSLNAYILGACLRDGDTNLVDLGRGFWAAPNLTGGEQRIQIHSSIEQMLENTGRPLTTKEIKYELSKSRDLAANFQIHPRGRLFRIGATKWGLIDRDLPLSKQDIEIYLDSLDKHLSETDSGIHVSEVFEVLNKSGLDISWIQDPELILSLCRRSGRFKITQTRYLIRNDWKNEQRVTP